MYYDPSATYDFLLVIHSVHGPMSNSFQDKWQKLQIFPHLYEFNSPTKGGPQQNFVMAVGLQKLEWCPF